MGYGGALIYSGLARNLKRRWPEKKVVFVYPWNLDELWWRRAAGDRQVWANNPDIDLVIGRGRWLFIRHKYARDKSAVINLDDPRYFYWIKDYGERVEYKSGKHAIQIACDVHNLPNCELRARLVVTREEEVRVARLLASNNLKAGQYVCVEPHTKDTFSPNKAWFFERWQELVIRLKKHFSDVGQKLDVVQVGAPGSPALQGVVSLVGKTTFRETAQILASSRLLVSAEGGLAHLAAAANTPAVVLMSAVFPPELMAYPQNKNLYADQACVCRGLKTHCPRGRACMASITIDNVYEAALEKLGETVPQPEKALAQAHVRS